MIDNASTNAATRADRSGPVTVIVGATGGIGSALAHAFEAHQLVLLGRDHDRVQALQTRFEQARCRAVDFTRSDSIVTAFEGLESIDHLIHCSGTISAARIEDAEREDWTDMFEANVLTPLAVTQAALPFLRSCGGTVVFISSGSARRVRPAWAGYAASKAACNSLAEGLRLEEPAIRVLSIYAGPIVTPMRAKLGEVPGVHFNTDDYLSVDEIIKCVRFGIMMRDNAAVHEIVIRPKPRR